MRRCWKQYTDLGQKCQALTGCHEQDRGLPPEDLKIVAALLL